MGLNNVEFSVESEKFKFLIDSGASLCAIKLDSIRDKSLIRKDNLTVNGICGNITAIGNISLELHTNGVTFEQLFYVFRDIPCNYNGIIGQNFLQKYKGIINFEENTLILNNRHKMVEVSLNSKNDSVLTIPSRCEIIEYLSINTEKECVVIPQEICEGVFLAGTVVKPKHNIIPVKILNTRETEVTLKNCVPEIHNLDKYQICSFSKITGISPTRVKELFSLINVNGLNKEEQLSIEELCAKFSDIFHLPNDKLTTTTVFKQTITLKPNEAPVYRKPYRIPHSQKQEVDKQIEDMIKNDVIEEAQSEWSSPILLVPKKADKNGNKKWRLVIDFRSLNEKIQDDKFPLPNIVDIFDSLTGAVYFSHLDLSQGYYQVELAADSRPYTAFSTHKNQYQMKRLPMGLKISCSAFSRLISIAMTGLNYEKCFCYLDDLIVFGRNLEQHNQNLLKVFSRLREVNLKLNPSKCEFLRKQILYLGHIISSEGLSPDPDKTKVLKLYPVPKNTDEVKRFIAFANYYRKFIRNFAEIANPLNKLCRKYSEFHWSEECQSAFEKLKIALSTAPVLDYPDFSDDNEFILQTDASGTCAGAVLSNKNNKPVAFASRPFNKSETNYSTIEKELAAVVWAVKYFRPYLFGRHFKIRTDHRPLVYLFNHSDPSSRLTKFRLCLQEYQYHIEYVKGSMNGPADALSRITSTELNEMNRNVLAVLTRAQAKASRNLPNLEKTSTNNRSDQPNVVEILKKPNDGNELIVLKRNDDLSSFGNTENILSETRCVCYEPNTKLVYIHPDTPSIISRDELLRDLEELCRRMNINELIIAKNEYNAFIVEYFMKTIAKIKWTGPRICIITGVKRIFNPDTKKLILNDFHILPTAGHSGVRKMINNIRRYYYWPGLSNDCASYVKKCANCQKHKFSKPIKEPMVITPTAHSAFEKVYLDIVGPLEKDDNGFIYVLTLQCDLTKFVEAYPLKSKDTVTVARAFVDRFILRYGVPSEIATDQGTEFISNTMAEICNFLRISHIKATAYHHQSIGSLENSHKTLNSFLRIQMRNYGSSWSSWIPYFCFMYNTSYHCSTRYSPYELVFGKKCNLPNNLVNSDTVEPLYNADSYPLELKFRLQKAQQDARQNLESEKFKRKVIYDRQINPITYEKDDLILLKSESGNKLQSVYEGPFSVIKDDSPNVRISKNGKECVVHKNRTKPFVREVKDK